ncbi:MAG: hypothetical protein RLZZ155_269 [Bacteroidota bacterium]|jgi:hypothetical protein
MKKLILLLLCAGYYLPSVANIIINVEFEKGTEKFTTASLRDLSYHAENLYLAKGIKVTLQEPNRNADVKKQALFYKREKELREFFKEEHLNFGTISFTYEQENNKGTKPVITIEIVPHAVLAEVIRPDSTFINNHDLQITCQYNDLDIANELKVEKLSSQEDLYNSNVSSFFDNKIIFIRELLKIDFPSGKIPNKPVTAMLSQSSELAKKQFILLQWNNINKEWTKIGSAKKPTKVANGYYYAAVFEESGIYALVESKSTSVTPVIVESPKNKALTYVELISNEPFIRIEGDISNNQREAKFKAPRDIDNYLIRAVCRDAQGKEWIEETKVTKKNIFSVFRKRNKVNAYFNNK